ncbi:hypothetical protein RJ55_07407 [Drechmeria coniospora]|nr:hypothetical protein RJ55_07407 [Drechmeria coniospora]
MAPSATTTSAKGTPAAPPRPRCRVILHLLRHGCGLIAFGLLFGFVVPMTPYPRLALTAHIQFCVEGTMVLAAGLLLQSDPFASGNGKTRPLADRLGPRQTTLIYFGLSSIWITLFSEALNAWWGTRWVLTLAHEAAGLKGDTAAVWMEEVVKLCHWPPAMLLATVFPTILYALFDED